MNFRAKWHTCIAISMLLSMLTASVNGADRGEKKDSAVFEEQALFQNGDDGYSCYRIPSLLVTKRGTVLAFVEARKNNCNDHGDVDLGVKRSTDNGRTWSKMQIIADRGSRTIGNPCPVVERETGTIWLPFCFVNKRILIMKSTDDGKSWSKPVDITKQAANPAWHWFGTGPGHGIQMANGRLVIPCWADAKPQLGAIQLSYAFYSDDLGKTWKVGAPLDADASDECEVVELEDGRLYMNARSRQGQKKRAFSFSKDGGQTWSRVKYDPRLPERSCQGSLVRFTDAKRFKRNRILLAHPTNPNARTKMTVFMSYDECHNWPVSRVVHQGSSAYSDLAVAPDSYGLLAYEADGYSKITLARFNVEWLTNGKDSLQPRSKP